MQGVAGSKGAQLWDFTCVYKEASDAYDFLGDYQAELNGTGLGQLVFAQRPLMHTAYSASGRALSGINLRDNIRESDNSNTPLELVYEAADCKLFYTADMINDVTLVWKSTVDARWNNNTGCVDGSTGDKTSVSGGVQLPRAQTSTAALRILNSTIV